jgi:hypothetical protein
MRRKTIASNAISSTTLIYRKKSVKLLIPYVKHTNKGRKEVNVKVVTGVTFHQVKHVFLRKISDVHIKNMLDELRYRFYIENQKTKLRRAIIQKKI